MRVLKFAIITLIIPAALASAQTAQVRHAPTLNGRVEGSVQQMTAEGTTLNGGAVVTGDLLIPGTPTVQLNGNPAYAGTLDGTGAATPTSHKVTLNGSASLRHVIRRTDAVTLPTVAAPPAPTGSVTVVVTTAGQSVDWSTARDVTLNSGVGSYAVPAGAYGDFTAHKTIKSREEHIREMWEAENKKPIDVYGKVIDQYGEPVVGAKVEGGTLLIEGFDRSGGENFSTVTDGEGQFSFTGLRGARFGLGIEKPGYLYDPKRYLGWWDNYKSGISDRAVFVMWKVKGAEPMVRAKVHAYVPCDGTVTSYDILTGRKASDGDLVLTLTRMPVNIVRGQAFDWKATVEFRNGGGIPISDTYPNEAPAEGYEPKITIEMPAVKRGWDAAFERSYYFRSGKFFGRMTVRIQADFQPPPTSFDVEIYANPSGSRNLEFDPAKTAKP